MKKKQKLQAILEISDDKNFSYLHPNFKLSLEIKDFDNLTYRQFKKGVNSIRRNVYWELWIRAYKKKKKDK